VLIERPDGSRLTVIVNIRPLKNQTGVVTGAINCFLDITERKQAEETRNRLAAIVDSSDDAIASEDLDGVITTWNAGAERLFGYTAQEAIGQRATLLISPERFNEEADMLEHVRRAAAVNHYETVRRRHDGTLFDASVTASPIRNHQGQVIGASTIARDITERKQAETTLAGLAARMREANEHLVVGTVRAHTMAEGAEQANHLKDEFLATVSHELRTPLNAIMGWARMLGSKQLPPDRASNALAIIDRNALALAHIIDDLLDVSRIVAGTLQFTPQPVDLVGVTQAALDVVRPLAVTKSVQLEFSPDLSDVNTVNGDAGRLQQVIWNLLANAIKFTPEGGRVDVFIARSNDQMEIRVVDTGQGLSPDFLPHVFERFRQADGATTRRHSGLGLGLAIVRELVELHGGTVYAASPGLGRGATFTIRLPIAAGEAHAGQAAVFAERRFAASTASPMPRLPRLDTFRILVVDDDADGRALTSLVLTQAGASVKAVGSVREALQLLEGERPDVLVSDIGLSDEDGLSLIRQIRQNEAAHGGFLPAVALTGFARAEDRARSIAAGFQAHVQKPVDPVDLVKAIATITGPVRDGEA
jgi:PAS domain S-box-containing protein